MDNDLKITLINWVITDNVVRLGKQGESFASNLVIDLSKTRGADNRNAYHLEVNYRDEVNYIPLEYDETSKSAVVPITSNILRKKGTFKAQLIATRTEESKRIVKKSNVFTIISEGSIMAENLPPIEDSAFQAQLRQIENKVAEAISYATHSPIIEDNYWQIWDGEQWQPTDKKATAPILSTVREDGVVKIYATNEDCSELIGEVHDGVDGMNGRDGADGRDGMNGSDGRDGMNGRDGADGRDGIDGKDGKDGHTPELTTYRVNNTLYIKSDGEEIGYVNDGIAPTITSEKQGNFLNFYAVFGDRRVYLGAVRDGQIPQFTTASDCVILQPNEAPYCNIDTVKDETGYNVKLVFHFGIPAGQKGDKGDRGETGERGEPGAPATDEQVQEAVEAYFDNNPIEEAVDSVARESILQMSESITDIEADLDELENNKVGFEDYAKSDKGGVVKALPAYGAYVGSTGILTSSTKTKEQYSSSENATFLCKGTLENVKSDVVRRALTDDTQEEWTEEQQTQARKIIGSYYKTESVDTVFEHTWLGNSDLWEEDEWNEGIYRLPEFFDGTENPVKNNNENIFVINGEEFVTRSNYCVIERDDYYFSISFAEFPYVYVVTNTKQDYNVSVKTRTISVNGVGSEYTGVCIQNVSFGNSYTDEIHYPGYTLIPVQFSKDLAEIDEAKNTYKLNITVNTEGPVQYYDDAGRWHGLRLFNGRLTQCYYNPIAQDGYYYAQYEFLAIDELTGESLFVYVTQRDNNHLDENFMVLFDGYNGALHYTNEHSTIIYLENGTFAEDFNTNTLSSVLLNGFYSNNPGVQNNTYVLNEVTERDTNGGSHVNLEKYFPCGCERKKIQKYNNYGNSYYVDEFWFNYTNEKVDEDGNIVKSIISFVFSQIDYAWKIYNEQSVTMANYIKPTYETVLPVFDIYPEDWQPCQWWGAYNDVYYVKLQDLKQDGRIPENVDLENIEFVIGDTYTLNNFSFEAKLSTYYHSTYTSPGIIVGFDHNEVKDWPNVTLCKNPFNQTGLFMFYWDEKPTYTTQNGLRHMKSKSIPYEAMPKAVKDFGEKIEELENSIGSVDSALQAMIDKAEGAL